MGSSGAGESVTASNRGDQKGRKRDNVCSDFLYPRACKFLSQRLCDCLILVPFCCWHKFDATSLRRNMHLRVVCTNTVIVLFTFGKPYLAWGMDDAAETKRIYFVVVRPSLFIKAKNFGPNNCSFSLSHDVSFGKPLGSSLPLSLSLYALQTTIYLQVIHWVSGYYERKLHWEYGKCAFEGAKYMRPNCDVEFNCSTPFLNISPLFDHVQWRISRCM